MFHAAPGVILRLLGRRPATRGAAGPFERGLEALDAGRFEAALTEFGAALESAQDPAARALTWNKRGVVLIALGRRADARAAFDSALAEVPTCAPALVNLGNLHLEAGEVGAAIASYEAAIRTDETYPLAYANLGAAYKRVGRHGDAVRALRTAMRLEIRSDARRRPLIGL